MAHECPDCGTTCDCFAGDILPRNCDCDCDEPDADEDDAEDDEDDEFL